MKRFFTSNYARFGKHPNAVAISRKPPKWYDGAICADVAPSWDLIMPHKRREIDDQQYTERYLQQLKERKIKQQTIVDRFNAETIFLCYESPKDFCHRHIFAKWLRQETDVLITELTTTIEQQRLLDDLMTFD